MDGKKAGEGIDPRQSRSWPALAIGIEVENQPHLGMGLIGIEERVRELGGEVFILSRTLAKEP
jgi:hypothetical protein